MASPTLATSAQVSLFCSRYSVTAATQAATTAAGPCCEFVGRCSSLVETVVPSAQTPPTLDMVAPQSVPMKTCWLVLMARSIAAIDGARIPDAWPDARPLRAGPKKTGDPA